MKDASQLQTTRQFASLPSLVSWLQGDMRIES